MAETGGQKRAEHSGKTSGPRVLPEGYDGAAYHYSTKRAS